MFNSRSYLRRLAIVCALGLLLAPTSCNAFDRGDVNGDGSIDGNDIPDFIDTILDPGGATPDQIDQADVGSPAGACVPDAVVDANDIPGMVLLLMGEECNFAPVILEGDAPISLDTYACAHCSDSSSHVQFNAIDPNGDTAQLQWSILSEPTDGAVTLIGATVGGQATLCYTPGAAATDAFSVLVEDNAGGADTLDVNVTVAPGPTPSITQTPIDNHFRLDAGPGYASYLWSPNGETTQTIDVQASGAYSVRVTDDHGCAANAATLVTIAGPVTLYRINAAGSDYTDPDGHLWTSDAGYYNLGSTSAIGDSVEILGTDLDPLYRSDRWDSAQSPEMMYTFDVTNGDYIVRLHFAETYWTVANRRIMDVAIENVVVLADYDIVAAVGPNTADVREFTTTVSDGQLNVEFLHNFENPKINAIEVIRPGAGIAPPSIAFAAPQEGATIVGEEVTVNWVSGGDLSAVHHVHLRLDTGAVVMLPDLSGAYTFTGVAPGAHSVSINLVDNNHQNLSNPEASDSVGFTTELAASDPATIAITAPLDGATIVGDEVIVNWQSGGDLSAADHVHLRLDTGTVVMRPDLSGAYTFTGVAPGAHTLSIQIVDANHENLTNPEALDSIAFTTQAATSDPATVVITSPANGAALIGTSLTVAWQTSGDLSVADHVHVSLDGNGHTSVFNLNGSLTFDGVAEGPHTLSVHLADATHQLLDNPEAMDSVSVTLQAPTTSNDVVLYRLNAGGPAYTDPDGALWSPDAGFFNVGGVFSTTNPIADTEADTLYQSERYNSSGATNMVYSFPVDAGTYRVRLHFAEIWNGAASAGVRVFDVRVEGEPALNDFDISAQVGLNTALITSYDAQVADGSLDITFIKNLENPKISAIEIIQLDVGELSVAPASVEWGHILSGEIGFTQTLTLTNPGVEPITISSVGFLVNAGVGHDFLLTLGGVDYVGDHDDISFPTSVTIPGNQSIDAEVVFLPTETADNDVWLEFRGNFAAQRVRLRGSGGESTGHPFLHVVIVAPSVVVDFDQDGSEHVDVEGHDSHTHELGHSLAAFEWRENGQLLATTADPTIDLPLGEHTLTLTIFDDNVPPEQLSLSQMINVVGPDAVPGALIRYYPTSPNGAAALLDAVPATAGYGEIVETLDVIARSGRIGNSPFSADTMVRVNARIAIEQEGTYEFVLTGGAATLLFVNGAAVSGPISLDVGVHAIDARFAVNTLANLPLQITARLNGAAATTIPAEAISHDETGLAPIINSAPTTGTEVGGNIIHIDGLGFVPLNQVVVHWGGTNISGESLTVTPTSVELTSPAGAGTIPVTIETPNGVSNSFDFTYVPGGPTPIVFTAADIASIAGPTTLAFGPDGRLYVATVQGKIAAYTLDDNGNVTATQEINTLNTATNKGVLGIAFNPFDPPSPVRLYVAHGQLFANGGACFDGASPYSGQVSVLTGPNFDTITPLITGLPVSNHDHGVNGMQFDNAGNLLVCVGGNTNAGIPACNIGNVPESPYSAAVLKAEIWRPDFRGAVQYIDRTTGAVNMDQVFGNDVDPIDGLDLHVFAPGLRNAYDLVYTTANRIYATDNGPNPSFGPASTSATTESTSDPNEGDEFMLVEEDHYYGHPNRNRGRCDDRQNVYHDLTGVSVEGVFTQMLTELTPSTDGVMEYRSETFNGEMRGDIIVQKWNGPTRRIQLSAEGRSVLANEALNVTADSLDITMGPGGAIYGANYSDNKISVLRPFVAAGFNAFDITPWRAPATGGVPFVIAGTSFGTLANTSVTIGGVPATLTSVSATRIRGVTPATANPPDAMVDVVVTVGSVSRTIPAAFRYLADPHVGHGPSASIVVDPGGNILGSSTYSQNSFLITNTSAAGHRIVRVTYDFRDAIFPDVVFDPTGNAGDTAFKPFQVNTDAGIDLGGHEFRCPHDGGFDQLVIRFDDFPAGQTFGFSVDADPTSINGATPPGPNDSGSISGLELTGAWITVVFDDGTSYRRQLFLTPGSVTGAQVDARPTALPRPTIAAVGIASTPANVTAAGQTIRVSGPAGANVRLLVVDGALYTSGLAGGGFDIDPYEANTARVVTEYNATIGAGGTVDVPVTLTKFDANAGINHIVAAFTDAQGRTSDVSNVIILDLN
ncbi:MAG TPA: malectin domain-containing carbohydrate-binding protein [Phycisphaerae bacterium]|nr:malectin domain-containing carbohydrate-binding protein [Phycisphaerae bacterium]HRW53599.1 malectin domain-containing carbohydrate-binding protein [Phycisphaerae bacterium]